MKNKYHSINKQNSNGGGGFLSHNSDNTPVVQIICVTYNQKDYISDALNSFLMQKTNFEFEVLVGDDCSTDGTSEIVAQYSKKYPDIIKHIRRQQNMGCLANFMDLCEKASAGYAVFLMSVSSPLILFSKE